MDKTTDKKTFVITGGSRGIGRAIALLAAERGNNVAIIYAGNTEMAEKTREECTALGAEAKAYRCSVQNLSECEGTAEEIIKDFGGADVLVNSAGITRDSLILRMKEDDFDAVIDVNLKGTFNMIKSFYSHFTKKRSGKIINLSSVSGLMGNAGQANYSASKAGIAGLTKSVAKEMARRGICCNAIAPGFIETDMTEAFRDKKEILDYIPLGRMGKADEVAALALFLAENDYITGEIIRIDGGMAM